MDASKVVNVTPRYAKLRAGSNGSARGQIIGWENIELISDRPLETMLKEFKQLKEEYPDRILIASIMEEYNKAAWEELIYRVEETGIVSELAPHSLTATPHFQIPSFKLNRFAWCCFDNLYLETVL